MRGVPCLLPPPPPQRHLLSPASCDLQTAASSSPAPHPAPPLPRPLPLLPRTCPSFTRSLGITEGRPDSPGCSPLSGSTTYTICRVPVALEGTRSQIWDSDVNGFGDTLHPPHPTHPAACPGAPVRGCETLSQFRPSPDSPFLCFGQEEGEVALQSGGPCPALTHRRDPPPPRGPLPGSSQPSDASDCLAGGLGGGWAPPRGVLSPIPHGAHLSPPPMHSVSRRGALTLTGLPPLPPCSSSGVWDHG